MTAEEITARIENRQEFSVGALSAKREGRVYIVYFMGNPVDIYEMN